MLSALVSSACTWLRYRRIRYVLLCLCSPILCFAFPILCAAELCLRFSRCRRRRRRVLAEGSDAEEDEKLRRCEEGCCGCAAAAAVAAENGADQVGLLQRYLEDQLLLVRSMYDCGDDDGDDDENDDALEDGGGDSHFLEKPLL